MLVNDIKSKFFNADYYRAIKIKDQSELEKLIKYIEEDYTRFDNIFNTVGTTKETINNIIQQWRIIFDENSKKKRYRFLAIRYSGYARHSQNSIYLDSNNIIYSNQSPIDTMLEIIDNYEKTSKLSNEQIQVKEFLNELDLQK